MEEKIKQLEEKLRTQQGEIDILKKQMNFLFKEEKEDLDESTDVEFKGSF